ncbi:MAG TPA: hypothetical protein VFZ59_06250 [Verrucomicrobiae bacterium]|nr:hypothetical protein [Verrucomicrobiae bacterium]
MASMKIGQTVSQWASALLGKNDPVQPVEPGYYCLIGNVVKEHEYGTAYEIKQGTKHFTPGTKVYCLPPQWGDGYEKTIAVGICRQSRRWITVVMSTKHVTNWRGKAVYSPVVLKRLREGFDGFNAQWKSRKEVDAWASGLRRRFGTES